MQRAGSTRLYAGESGESHFEEVEVGLAPVDFAPPAPPLNIAPFLAASQCMWVGAPAGWGGETPHPAPQRQVFVAAQGEYEITASDGTIHRFKPGAVLLLEDTWSKGHSTRIVGDHEALVFAVVLADSESG